MSLENEEGMQWFRKGWARGRQQSTPADIANKIYERTISDARLIAQFKASCPEPIWNSPCTLPDKPGVYEVTPGARSIAIWTRTDGGPRKRILRNEAVVELAHWNGVRWGSLTSPLYPPDEPGYRDSDIKLAEMRRFNPRQDYPWREVAA